jgi:hypothetical protein
VLVQPSNQELCRHQHAQHFVPFDSQGVQRSQPYVCLLRFVSIQHARLVGFGISSGSLCA